MNADRFTVRRIVVAIDNSSHAAAALEAAAGLAARLHAELEGIFVQDINLARLAELPVGREIRFPTGQGRDFTSTELDAQYQEQEVHARRAIAAAAGRARVGYSFRVTRGQVETEVITAAGDADLLILGMSSRPLGGRARPGRIARAMAERAPRSVLLSKPGTRISGKALVCYDGTAGARRALEAAAGISGGQDDALTVLVIADDLDRAAALRSEVDAELSPFGIRPKFLHSPDPTPGQMCQLSSQAGADVLVISADDARIEGEGRLRLLEGVACPVLLVR